MIRFITNYITVEDTYNHEEEFNIKSSIEPYRYKLIQSSKTFDEVDKLHHILLSKGVMSDVERYSIIEYIMNRCDYHICELEYDVKTSPLVFLDRHHEDFMLIVKDTYSFIKDYLEIDLINDENIEYYFSRFILEYLHYKLSHAGDEDEFSRGYLFFVGWMARDSNIAIMRMYKYV